jgi:hypothetical protein
MIITGTLLRDQGFGEQPADGFDRKKGGYAIRSEAVRFAFEIFCFASELTWRF